MIPDDGGGVMVVVAVVGDMFYLLLVFIIFYLHSKFWIPLLRGEEKLKSLSAGNIRWSTKFVLKLVCELSSKYMYFALLQQS